FGDGGEAELQTGAPRGVFDFRLRADDFLDVLKDAFRLSERASGRSVVIQDEAAFVHFREQSSFQEAEAQDRENDDSRRADDENPGTLEESAHRIRIEVDDTAESTGE